MKHTHKMNGQPAALILSALILAAALMGCGGRASAPAPDLTGRWEQKGSSSFYHRATITKDTISIYWYEPETDTSRLYWAGTFIPPENGEEPYEWESVNDLARAEKASMALRDETKKFTYEDGKISYTMSLGRFKMIVALERMEA